MGYTASEQLCEKVEKYKLFEVDFLSLKFTAGIVQTLVVIAFTCWSRVGLPKAELGRRFTFASFLLPVHLYTFYTLGSIEVGLNVFLPTVQYVLEKNPSIVWFQSGSVGENICIAAMYGMEHAVVEGVAYMLLQSSMGTKSLQRTVTLSTAWGCVVAGLAYCWTMFPNSQITSILHLVFYSTVLVFYLFCWLAPYTCISRRPALIEYSMFWSVASLVVVVSEVLYNLFGLDIGMCLNLFGADILFTVLIPALFYRTLRRDSEYWQGTLKSSVKTSLSRPLLGTSLRRDSAAEVAVGLDVLEAPEAKTLNFAFLNVPEGRMLGSGGSSRVYKGTYMGQEVAVKILFCIDLTRNVIRRFFREIQIHAELRHSSVVKLKGVCIVPPAICLVMECMNCSLYDFLHSREMSKKLEWRHRIRVAIGCAQAITFLHMCEPPVLHGDVKSMNFLVSFDEHDEDKIDLLKVKISDLGCSRRVPNGVYTDGAGSMSGFTVIWSAPEVFEKGPVSVATDVYALGIVLYEVFTGKVPFHDYVYLTNDELATEITKGLRPTIPDKFPARLYQTLQHMWSSPAKRPSAQEVLEELVKVDQTPDILSELVS